MFAVPLGEGRGGQCSRQRLTLATPQDGRTPGSLRTQPSRGTGEMENLKGKGSSA